MSLVVQMPGYLQDTKQVLSSLQGHSWRLGYVWITGDVMLLYTVIPHDNAILALEWFLDTYLFSASQNVSHHGHTFSFKT